MRRIHLLLALGMSLIVTAPAVAQQRAPEDVVSAEVEPREARVGASVEVTGTGWAPETQIEIAYRNRPLAFATVAAEGTFRADVQVPNVEAPTAIRLDVSGTAVTGEETSFEVQLNVETGTPRGTWIVLGVVAAVVLLVLILGWAMILRRRRPSLRQQVAEGKTPVRNPDPRKEPQPHDDRR